MTTLQELNVGAAPRINLMADEARALSARVTPDPEALEARIGRALGSWHGGA